MTTPPDTDATEDHVPDSFIGSIRQYNSKRAIAIQLAKGLVTGIALGAAVAASIWFAWRG